jgi:tetratricopeptide (TPR) repeat protein
LIVAALAVLGVTGCASLGGYSSVVVTPAQSAVPAAPVAPTAISDDLSLAAIINTQLQPGHYVDGERALRHYLKQHPGDRAAQGMLRQLTADPAHWLGSRWRAHVVQAGESYSTLADRFLGDANKFLILARYNDSTNPSLLRVGQTLRIPLSASGAAAGTPAADAEAAAPDADSGSAKAHRLQDESVSLLEQGHKDQALARLGEALAIDPRLQPAGAEAAALRSQLLDSYHERAIVLYRDQQLDQAIVLWNRVLAIAPGYEPAVVYRARALELKQRLRQY